MLSACMTDPLARKQKVTINSDPVGSMVTFSDGQSCYTPCYIYANRNENLEVVISRLGFITKTMTIRSIVTSIVI